MNKKINSGKSPVAEKELSPDNHTEQEFGGAVGAALIMIFSHVLPYYLWISNFFYGGRLIYPDSF
jgi:hypothetical protein